MENIDLLITAQWILPIAPENTVLENHALAVKDGQIVNILPLEDAKQQYYADQYLEYKSHVLMPGFVNAHAHTPMNLFRGLADDLSLMDWLQHHIWPAEKAIMNASAVAAGTRLAIAEMLRGGITCFNDHYFFYDTIAEVAKQEHLRACVGLEVINVPTQWADTEKAYLDRVKKVIANPTQSDLITYALAPHAPYTVSKEALLEIKKLSEQHHLPIHMHVHETKTEVEQGIKTFGKRPLEYLHELGLLSSKFIAVHMTQLTEEEINLVERTKTNVVHCPESNLKLASGFAPIAKLLAKRINVAIGTDSAASNNDLDMFGEIRTAALTAKAVGADPTHLPAAEALKMATLNGAKALGLEKVIGSLEPGKYADMIAVNLDSFLTQPIYNPVSQLVYAANRLQVSDVWVAGKQLLKLGEFTCLDIEKTLEEALRWTQQAQPFKSHAKVSHQPLFSATK